MNLILLATYGLTSEIGKSARKVAGGGQEVAMMGSTLDLFSFRCLLDIQEGDRQYAFEYLTLELKRHVQIEIQMWQLPGGFQSLEI